MFIHYMGSRLSLVKFYEMNVTGAVTVFPRVIMAKYKRVQNAVRVRVVFNRLNAGL